jgi:protein involved in sex pheromone biosynthesis
MKKLFLFSAFVAVLALSACTPKAKEEVAPIQDETPAPAPEEVVSDSTIVVDSIAPVETPAQ